MRSARPETPDERSRDEGRRSTTLGKYRMSLVLPVPVAAFPSVDFWIVVSANWSCPMRLIINLLMGIDSPVSESNLPTKELRIRPQSSPPYRIILYQYCTVQPSTTLYSYRNSPSLVVPTRPTCLSLRRRVWCGIHPETLFRVRETPKRPSLRKIRGSHTNDVGDNPSSRQDHDQCRNVMYGRHYRAMTI